MAPCLNVKRKRPDVIRTGTSRRRAPAALAGLSAALLALPAAAAATYTVQVSPNADLGPVTAGVSGDTVFRVDPATGNVSQLSGSGSRSGSGITRATVTVRCAATQAGDCSKKVNVGLSTVGSPIGRGRSLTHLQVAMGTGVFVTMPTSSASPSFTMGPIGPNSAKTFFIGADFGIAGDDTGLPTGLAEADFLVVADEKPVPITSGVSGRIQAQVFRGIALSKTSDLAFGTVSRPSSGAGAVTIDPATGARTTSGPVVAVSSTTSRAGFLVTGEGGQAFSITVPATFAMSGPQTLTVTTASSAAASPVLSGALGSAGTYAFGVGGSVSLDASTLAGSYTGSFTVTVAYN